MVRLWTTGAVSTDRPAARPILAGAARVDAVTRSVDALPAPEPPAHSVLGVIGGCGGAGATSLAAVLTVVAAAQAGTTPVLIDLDALGGGVDVTLGAESVPGPRWSGLHATGGRLDPDQLLDGLPRWRAVPFLACDQQVPPSADAVRSVLRAARQIGPTVVDLGRSSTPARTAALALSSALVMIVPAEIRAVTAAAALRAALAEDGFGGVIRVVVRVDDPVIGPRRVADVLDLPLAGSLGPDRGLRAARDRGVDPRRLRRRTRALARELTRWAATMPTHPGQHQAGPTLSARAPAVQDRADRIEPARAAA